VLVATYCLAELAEATLTEKETKSSKFSRSIFVTGDSLEVFSFSRYCAKRSLVALMILSSHSESPIKRHRDVRVV